METFLRIVFYIKKNHRKYHKKFTVFLLCFMGLALLIFNIKPAGSATVTFVQKWGVQGAGHGQFESPAGLAIDSSGNVYVADSNNNRIQKFDSGGVYITQWGSFGTGDGKFNTPSDVAIDSNNNVYVTDSNNSRVEKFDSSGNFITQWGVAGAGDGQFSGPVGLTVDNSGNVYVADSGNNRIQKFTVNGVYETQWGAVGSGAGEFSSPHDVAVDPWNNVYVTDENNSRVEKFDSSGNFITQWGTNGTSTGNLVNPSGIAIDKTGNVYVADRGNNRIQRFDPSGTGALTWGSLGSGNGQFDNATGVNVDSSNKIYVADTSNHRIQEFSISYDLGPYVSNADPDAYRGVNNVFALIKIGNRVYLGGDNGLEVVDATNGAKIDWDFNSPLNPSSGTTAAVLSFAYSSNTQTLYAGTDDGVRAYDLSSGNGTFIWQPNMHWIDIAEPGKVEALAIDGDTLYVGGLFDSVDTKPRSNLVSFNIATPGGVLTDFIADITPDNGDIRAMKIGNGNLYVGGSFDSIGGINQPTLAMIDLSGTATVSATFTPEMTQTPQPPTIYSLEYYNGNLYVGGSFTDIGGSSFTNLARLNGTTGVEDTTWNHPAATVVLALAVKDNYLYVGESNQFDPPFNNAYAYNLTSDELADWLPADTQAVYAILPEDDALYMGLHGPPIDGYNNTKTFNFVKNIFSPQPAYADIGGLIGTIYFAVFHQFAAMPTATPAPSTTPTPSPTPTPGPTSTPTNTPTPTGTLTPTSTGTLTPTPTGTGTSASSASLTPTPTFTAVQLTQAAGNATIAKNLSTQNNGKLPPSGPQDIINLGLLGFIFVIIGAGLLLVAF